MAARSFWSPSGLHCELRPGCGSFATYWHSLLLQLGSSGVSVSVIAPSNRPVVNVPPSQRWPLEAELFEFLVWFRLFLSPSRLAEMLAAECDAASASASASASSSSSALVSGLGAVRLATVWLLKSPSLGDSESVQGVLAELLCRQQLETTHDYRRLHLQLRNVRDAAIVHNEVVKRATGTLAQQLSLRFISMTKIKNTEHFLLLEELGPDTVSRVLMLHACNLFGSIGASHLSARVHQVVFADIHQQEKQQAQQHPLNALIAHHRALANWATGVALQSRAGLSSNLSALGALARMSLRRGDAFSAAAVLQGAMAPAVQSVRALPVSEPLMSANARLGESALSESLPALSSLLHAVVFAETSRGHGGTSFEFLDFSVLREIALAHDMFLSCAERARAVLLANNGPHLSTDKVKRKTVSKLSF